MNSQPGEEQLVVQKKSSKYLVVMLFLFGISALGLSGYFWNRQMTMKQREQVGYEQEAFVPPPSPTLEELPAFSDQLSKIFVLGGLTKDPVSGYDRATNSGEFYSFKENRWSPLPPMNERRSHMAVAALGSKVYVFGGGGEITTPTTTVEEFDTATNRWTVKRPMPNARLYAQAVSIRGEVYVFGGQGSSTEVFTALDIYNPETDTWRAGAPLPISNNIYTQPCATVADLMYCPGIGEYGYTLVYHPDSNSWTSLATQNRDNLVHTWTSNDKKLYGTLFSDTAMSLYEYDLSTDSMKVKPLFGSLEPFYSGYGLVAVGDYVVVAGGSYRGGNAVKDAYVTHIHRSFSWLKIAPLLIERTSAGTVVVQSGYSESSQSNGSIAGTVVDNGTPMANIRVELQMIDQERGNDASELIASTQTDSKGRYAFKGLRGNEKYSVRVADLEQGGFFLPMYKGMQSVVLQEGQEISDYDYDYSRPMGNP